MTSREALDGFKRHMETYHRHPVKSMLDNEIKILEKLVERDTPKKVYSTDYHYCPNCNTHYLTKYQKFCDYCGQRLDWSEE